MLKNHIIFNPTRNNKLKQELEGWWLESFPWYTRHYPVWNQNNNFCGIRIIRRKLGGELVRKLDDGRRRILVANKQALRRNCMSSKPGKLPLIKLNNGWAGRLLHFTIKWILLIKQKVLTLKFIYLKDSVNICQCHTFKFDPIC